MNPKLLLVEDNRALNTMLRWQLSDREWAVVTAHSCAEALELAGRSAVDLVVLDYHLPDGDGIDLFRRLEKLHPGLRGVMMSGDRQVSLAEAPVAGLRGILPKPVHLPTLLRQLQLLQPPERRAHPAPPGADRLPH